LAEIAAPPAPGKISASSVCAFITSSMPWLAADHQVAGAVRFVARLVGLQVISSEMSSCDCPYLIVPRDTVRGVEVAKVGQAS
jgi:hypothetical protein